MSDQSTYNDLIRSIFKWVLDGSGVGRRIILGEQAIPETQQQQSVPATKAKS